jgi:hypothetical protein
MLDDPQVMLLGEDLLDPYGGAFKVARGLSSAFPDQVLTTPISEAGITGIAGGMALRGMRPVVEIMFGDFTTLIADQVINHMGAKFNGMYHGQAQRAGGDPHADGWATGLWADPFPNPGEILPGCAGLTVLAPFNLLGEAPWRARPTAV